MSIFARLPAARYRLLVVATILVLVFFYTAGDRAQTAHAESGHAHLAAPASQLADGWRRTACGWERLSLDARDNLAREAPSQHVALAQAWPAAWAACLVLSIVGLAAAGAEWKQIDARAARGDQVGYDLRSAT